jgi:hypothetical protein
MPEEFPDFLDDDERCYCSRCIAGELAEEADEYYWRVKHPDPVECALEDSLLQFASSENGRAASILLGYCNAYNNYMSGTWPTIQ